jgi:NAD(P)-dependent dehydrogenase (short-subunit alcohol dehydrogenase family)
LELIDRVACVTGAGSGIGRASALKLADAGAHVVLMARTAADLEEVAAMVEATGRQALVLPTDVGDEAAMKAAFATIRKRFGRLDIVVANAGINGTWAPIDEIKPSEWDETHTINLRGTFLTLHFAVPLMREAGGAIVITASINGTRTFSNAGATAYSVTKAGQLALGQMAALELARDGIRVNVVCPGAIDTDIDDSTSKRHIERAKVVANYPDGTIPLTGGRPGTADDVAELVLFLCSDRARHITGTPVWIDGAQSLLI